MRGVAFYEGGFKRFKSNQLLKDPNDFRGMDVRTMESDIIVEQFNCLGA